MNWKHKGRHQLIHITKSKNVKRQFLEPLRIEQRGAQPKTTWLNSISGQANNWEKENGESGEKGVQADKGLC